MSWKVRITTRATKDLGRLPAKIRDLLDLLAQDIELTGPVRGDWPKYSKLADGSHHCHLTYRYVACWRVVDGKTQITEVYYVGSRESAPY